MSQIIEDNPALGPAQSSSRHGIGINEKASISDEELNTGMAAILNTTKEKIPLEYSFPGSYPNTPQLPEPPSRPPYKPLEWGNTSQKPVDPTLDYSILLIAKPIPFKFKLEPRDDEKVAKIRALFRDGQERGDYPESREYWGPDQGRTSVLGWSRT